MHAHTRLSDISLLNRRVITIGDAISLSLRLAFILRADVIRSLALRGLPRKSPRYRYVYLRDHRRVRSINTVKSAFVCARAASLVILMFYRFTSDGTSGINDIRSLQHHDTSN